MARRKIRRSVDSLPQRAETWHVVIKQLRAWIAPPDEDPWRPFALLVFNIQTGVLQKMEVLQEYPKAQQLSTLLAQAMQEPPKGVGQKPHRPTQIQLEDDALVADLSSELKPFNIDVQHHPRLEGMNEIIDDLEEHLRGGPELPGLLSVKGVTPQLAAGLFAAAAQFYRDAPWVHLSDQQTLAVRVTPEEQPRFVQVMGGGGVEYGLAMYRRWEDVERMYSFTDSPFELLPPEGGHSFFFDNASKTPFDDLEAIEEYNWEVANKHAYPVPIIYTRQGDVRRPSADDLFWYQAALRAIPVFVREHLQRNKLGDYKPAETTLTVSSHTGETQVHLKYPGGALSKETRPVNMVDWPELELEEDEDEVLLPFDRRAMEGMLGQFAQGFDDPNLQEAQELMYQAWEETNPATRIILAHEALSISSNCSDAYVLLAEEEADTLGRALEYYQKGVTAGEQTLGEEYFKENVGYFWGLLETRPYMRARQGLANILWELGRIEEAIQHYQDMLRLNPGDNQGIRYSLLNLLVGQNRNEEAMQLLEQYDDDAMAEWLYTRALLEFKAHGPGKAAEQLLQQALETNSHVPTYLTGRKRIPVKMPAYITWGGEDEAITYASAYLPHWRQTPGAIDWLKEQSAPTGSKRKSSSKPKRRRGKRGSSRKS